MKYLVPLCLYGLVAGLFFLGFGGMANTRPNLEVVYAWDTKDGVWTSELDFWSDWSINPCKYTYGYWENETRVGTTISNLSNEDLWLDLGDGEIVAIPVRGNTTHHYQVALRGQTERRTITRLTEGTGQKEALNLVIEPRTKGGD